MQPIAQMSREELIAGIHDDQQELLRVRQNVSGYANPNSAELEISSADLRYSIKERVQDVYDSISVDQIDYLFAGEKEPMATRKIVLNRTWGPRDLLAPLLPFLGALFSRNSMYTRAIDESSIAEFILIANVPETEAALRGVFDRAKEKFLSNHSSNREFLFILSRRNDLMRRSAENQRQDQNIGAALTELEEEIAEEYRNETRQFFEAYNKEYNAYRSRPKENLKAAYRQSQEITIFVPNKLSRQAVVHLKTTGIVTPLAINAGTFLRSIVGNQNN